VSAGGARVLIVANPGDAPELLAAFAEPLPIGPVDVVTGDGGDDTLGVFAARRPEVVVVSASLDAGDARALIAAMRENGPVHVVLVGDARGPIRNALDASDFGVDRFVARPLSAKALRFAVGSGIGAVRTGFAGGSSTDGAPRRSAMIAAQSGRSGLVRAPRVSGTAPVVARDQEPELLDEDDVVEEPDERATVESMPIVDAPIEDEASDSAPVPVESVVSAAVTAPIAEPAPPSMTALKARWETLADSLELDDEPDASIPPPPVTIRPRRAQSEPLGADEPTPVPAGDDWGAAPPIAREPTVILPEPALDAPAIEIGARDPDASFDDGDLGDEGAVPYEGSGEIDLTERHADGHWAAAASVRAVRDEGEDSVDRAASGGAHDLDDLSVDGPADLGDVSGSHALPPEPPPPPASGEAAPPSGTGFARELREKMSRMAERLFQRGVAPAPGADSAPPAIGPLHDHRTEIDLAAIAEPPPAAANDFDADGTFAGDRDESVAPTQTGLARETDRGQDRVPATDKTGESGALARGSSDAAALIARLASAQFTGRLVLRRGPVEKTLFFDGGRPVFASSNEDGDRLGLLLVREGKITALQLAGCDAAVRDTGRRMGEILVDRGYLKRRELLPAVRRHVEDILYSTFAWDAGEYRIVAGDGAESERIRLSRDPAAMVLEGVRRKLDRATLERLVGPPTTIVEIADREKLAAAIAAADLAADERAAVAGLDAKHDLAHVARHAGAPLDTVYAIAWSLILLGVAAAHRGAGEPSPDDDAPGMVGEDDLAIDRERVEARARLVVEADYFALLGVRRGATRFEIRRAYEAARKDFASEGFPLELRRELAAELADIAQVLDEAYRVLRDDQLRTDYLTHLVD
jgi:hypothetical protein